MKIDRLLGIITILQQREKVTAPELAEEIKTISNNEEHKMELYFETDDIEKTFKYILNANITVMHEIRLQPWGQKVFRVYDPDGNIVEIGEAMSIVNERMNYGNN